MGKRGYNCTTTCCTTLSGTGHIAYGWFSENVHQCVTEVVALALDLHVLVANSLVQCATYTV